MLFTYTTVNMEEDRHDSHIWLSGLRTMKTTQFTHGRSSESNPRWSPKGDRILFTSNCPSTDDPEVEGKKKKKAQQ